jgi:hypothetical protein
LDDRLIPEEPESFLEFQTKAFELLQLIERERFNMPWRWN